MRSQDSVKALRNSAGNTNTNSDMHLRRSQCTNLRIYHHCTREVVGGKGEIEHRLNLSKRLKIAPSRTLVEITSMTENGEFQSF